MQKGKTQKKQVKNNFTNGDHFIKATVFVILS